MKPNERAQQNHDVLFPGDVSNLAVTDPELIEIYDNFAFDEVLRNTKIDARARLMVQLASMIACQALHEYRAMGAAILNVGNDRVRLIDVVTQLLPFIGYPRTLNALKEIGEAAPAQESSPANQTG